MTPLHAIENRLKSAIETERYGDVEPLLLEYARCVSAMAIPPQQDVLEFIDWAQRSVAVARAHAVDEFQLLSDSRGYSEEESKGNTWQVTL